MRLQGLLVLLLSAAACGGDDAPPPPAPPPPRPPGAPGAPGGPKSKLAPRVHVEDRVECPVPEKATGPECKPDSLSCEQGRYCLPIANGSFHCEPCLEREAIRHDFKDRDFVPDQVRDPFQSFVIAQVGGPGSTEGPRPDTTRSCTRDDQFKAPSYSYQDLHLVGIVAQGTQRKVLMTDSTNYGWIIRRGDCVGKEKALVKDIGTGYVTFVVEGDPNDKVKRAPEEHSIQLHTTGLNLPVPGQSDQSAPPPGATVAPPSARGTQPAPAPSGAAGEAPAAPVAPPPAAPAPTIAPPAK